MAIFTFLLDNAKRLALLAFYLRVMGVVGMFRQSIKVIIAEEASSQNRYHQVRSVFDVPIDVEASSMKRHIDTEEG